MEGPLSIIWNFSHSAEMIIAIIVGIGFGFTLERAGFGRADNLVAIFYGRDFRVLRVMFSAIVTAMIGLYFFDLLGILPIHSIGILDTYILPQLIGGLLVGMGFMIGGYCPGTSIVASAGGKIDAMLFVFGLLLGSLTFNIGYSSLMSFHNSGYLGRVLIHEALNLPAGIVVMLVALMAVGAFAGAAKVESWVNRRWFS